MNNTKKNQDFSQITPKISNKFEIGAIIISEWGYEQTKVYYYMVVGMSEKFASIVPMNKKIDYNKTVGRIAIPDGIKNTSEIVRRKINTNKITGIQHVCVNDFEDAYLWDGLSTAEDGYTR